MNGNFREQSDVDILVRFDKSVSIDLFDAYFSLKEALENFFQRTVDLVVEKEFKNKYFRESVDATKELIYERKNS